MQTYSRRIFAASIISLLTACATIEEKMIEAGATRLNASQVKAHIVGKTEKWTRGGGYYDANGMLETVWEGVSKSGPYAIQENGKVCYEVKSWDRECHFYMNDKGTITMIYKGKNVGAHEVMRGNQLSTL